MVEEVLLLVEITLEKTVMILKPASGNSPIAVCLLTMKKEFLRYSIHLKEYLLINQSKNYKITCKYHPTPTSPTSIKTPFFQILSSDNKIASQLVSLP